MRRTILVALVTSAVLTAWPAWLPGQPVFTGAEIFPAEEFAARRARVMDRVGGAVAVVQGTTERPGEQPLRQNNQFFYLTGVVEPRAIVLLDGRATRTTLFLLPLNERREGRMFGPGLHPGEEAVKATGIDAVLARDEFAKARRPHDLHDLPARGPGGGLVQRSGRAGTSDQRRSVGRARHP